ncbi:hypothetical protein IQ283_14120 [Alkalihalobacillus hwajinpoensis]|uniref:hypothetical protein n=1 Tax=Guptibacillus hwajinpoensis TaxID=208199 RepID=UPI0018833235|nr:hypothetical protein [Pseudalkalibacillus hwajinpoensis]MBF0707729.1 hypothetical protein [Pseudalkalibacillus hwajinpoensis]
MGNEQPITDPEKVSAEDLPDTRAMQDEFTRSFLKSTKEVEEGYYLFQSGIDRFEMYFPNSGLIGEKGYYGKKGSEQFIIGIEETHYEIGITMEYARFPRKEDIETSLSVLEGKMDEKRDVEKVMQEGREAYYAKFTNDDLFGYSAYVQNTNETGGIFITYSIKCLETTTECDEEDAFIKWLKSIKFKEEELSENSA